MKVFIIASLAIQLLCLGLVQGQERLPIQIYYEALCPDSVNFVQNQLFPNFAALRDYIDILYVPFGKASSHNDNGIIEFTCQHGPAECTGNRVQSCTLRALRADPDRQTEFVACQMAFGVDQTGQTCVAQVGVTWDYVDKCYRGRMGLDLQLEAEELTMVITPAFVPTIVYNWQFNQVLQDRSLTEFVTVVCEQINNAAPICTQ